MLKVEFGLGRDEATERVKAWAKEPREAATKGTRRTDHVRPSQGNSAEYLTARVARDRPDILKRMQPGEFPSFRKAAIEAGIVRVPTALELGQRAWAKMSKAEQDELDNWLAEQRRHL
jgi:hypothetical protein